MSEQALADYGCPHSEEFTEKTIFQKARKCRINKGEPCWNWRDYAAVMSCEVKKEYDRKHEET